MHDSSQTSAVTAAALPSQARPYLIGIVTAGLITIALRFLVFPPRVGTGELLLLVLALMVGRHTVKIGKNLEMSGVLPLIFTAMISSGLPAALDVAFVGMLSTCLCGKKIFKPYRAAFNISSLLLTTLVSGSLYAALEPDLSPSASPQFLLALFIAVAAFYLLNTSMVAAVVGLTSKRSIPQVWRDAFAATWLSYFAGASLAVGVATLIQFTGQLAAVLLVAPVLLILHSFKLRVGIREATQSNALAIELLDRERLRRVEIELRLERVTGEPRTMQENLAPALGPA